MSSFGARTIPRATLLRLQNELRELKSNVDAGFVVFQPNETNFLSWKVAIFGAPDTVYQGGYFVANLSFPDNYPFAPPVLKFTNPPLHPNVYPDGTVCISILHSAQNEATSGEADNERWNITQSVRTVLLSIISMLNEPNLSSPANVDAARMFRDWKENKNTAYTDQINVQIEESKAVASTDGISVPLTQEQYLKQSEDAKKASDAAAKASEMDLTNDPIDFTDDNQDE
uniref:UBC core domain-containing protein n=1 Tax=Ditylenchus dipsaci TaxID=166011 RepID=A0A915E4B9_9BILA